jgi:aspartate carbamoyltransferase regulatory subunit
MNIDGVNNGIVLDHISPGMSMKIYHLLKLDELDCSVAIIQNVDSRKYGKKDILKIDAPIDLDLDVLGYVDPKITVNIVRNQQLAIKKHLELPSMLSNVLQCKNPRCITTSEQEIEQIFKLIDRDSKLYRCIYCETESS